MKRPPFKMLPSRQATLTCDGKHVVSGRASFVWENFLLRRISGVPGAYEISARNTKKHRLDWTPEEARLYVLETAAQHHRTIRVLAARKIARALVTRAARQTRGLPVG